MITDEEWKYIRGSQKRPDHIMLSINGDPTVSMTVTWRTCNEIKSRYALFRRTGESEFDPVPYQP